MGPSGSGKSTLLHCLGGVDRADQGSLLFEGNNLQQMGEEAIALFEGNESPPFFNSSIYCPP